MLQQRIVDVPAVFGVLVVANDEPRSEAEQVAGVATADQCGECGSEDCQPCREPQQGDVH